MTLYVSPHLQIFVVDSCASDVEINEVRTTLEKCLSNQELRGLPLLLLCNKQDLPSARSVDQVSGHCSVQSQRMVDNYWYGRATQFELEL